MKKSILAILLVVIALGGAWGQDLNALADDITTLLTGIGDDSLPYLMQNALAGLGIGMASMDEKHFYISTTLGTVMTDGFLKVVDDTGTNFELLNADTLLSAIFADGTAANVYDKSKTFFLYPNARLSMGLKPFLGIEIIGLFAFFPGALTDVAVGLVPEGTGADFTTNLEFNRINAGVRIRKALVEDAKFLPAISLGAGYSYSNFHLAVEIPSDLTEQDFSGLTMQFGGNLNFDTSLHAAGIELSLSKRLLFFVPFLNIGAWYQWSSYDAEITDLLLRLLDPLDDPVVTEADLDGDIESHLTLNDLSVIFQGGFELGGRGFAIVPNGSYNLSTGSFGAGISSRIMF